MTRLLVIEDDAQLRRFLVRDLNRAGFETIGAEGGVQGIDTLRDRPFDAVVCDLHMPDKDGFDVLHFATMLAPPPPFIMLTAYGSVGTAVEAMKHGAADFLEKPITIDELAASIRAVLDRRSALAKRRPTSAAGSRLVGSPLWLGPFVEMLRHIAQSDATVLIDGETGTGKSAVAREIWRSSRRSTGPFVEINCAAIPEQLMESELFGHVKGSFTGAVGDHDGKVARADGGTLFLDEVGELRPELQAKLLHLLQDRAFTPVGGAAKSADVRFIAATNRDLSVEVEKGTFRRDLFYRLEVVSLTIPPLRDRPSDVPILVDHFRTVVSERLGRGLPSFTPEAMAILRRYDWPGNIRQLENLIERFAAMHMGPEIGVEHLPERIRKATTAEPSTVSVPEFSSGQRLSLDDLEASGVSLADAVKSYETGLIKAALDHTNGNRSQAAKLLRVNRTTLVEKLRKLGAEGIAEGQ
jgi:DNA-binding NtrC family response regulator